MRILVAGATGVLGRVLVPKLVGGGHDVWGLARSDAGAQWLESVGASAARGDALVLDDVRAAVEASRPEVVMQQLTALPQKVSKKTMADGYAKTSELRTVGTRNLLEAAPDARCIAQSIAFTFKPEGDWVKDEDAPLHTADPVIAELERMEQSVVAAGGIVLRYGYFYGPGTWYSREGAYADWARKRMLNVVGSGDATASFLHIEDAADATVAALDGGEPGVYHVTDDHPIPQREWVPAFAAAVGAKKPRKVPVWLVKLLAGDAAFFLTEVRGADNAKFKRTFGWRPSHPDPREGFKTL